MGSVNVKNNSLYLDFRYQGVRCKLAARAEQDVKAAMVSTANILFI
ncbi:Arm DNA-binding domain-containing protein [Vibrio minamisatsumaniensis]